MIFPTTSAIDRQVLEHLLFLFSLKMRKQEAVYALCGRKYLADRIGCCLRTISRSTERLCERGLLIKEQRRPVRGQYQTCIYKPTPYLFQYLRRFILQWLRLAGLKSPSGRRKSNIDAKISFELEKYFAKSPFWNKVLPKRRGKLRC